MTGPGSEPGRFPCPCCGYKTFPVPREDALAYIWFQISEARLKAEGAIPTPMGQTLYWDSYCYIRQHSIGRWPFPTDILRGAKDSLCASETVSNFAERFYRRLQIAEGAEHWFHTPEDLVVLSRWLRETSFVR